MKKRVKTVKAALVIMGILCYAVLLLPWYELVASAHISGVGSSSISGGKHIGLVMIGSTYFGYGLYLLPAAMIILGLDVISSIRRLPTRFKALLTELLALAEVFCLFMANREISNYATDFSESGFSAFGGYVPLTCLYIALGVYILTGIVGIVMMFVSPNPRTERVDVLLDFEE